jgi:hypothetical protein
MRWLKEVITVEHRNLSAVYAEVKISFNKFAKLWQGWGITAETIYEGDDEGLWLLKHGENVLRPLRISIIPDSRSETELPWISLMSNEKTDTFKAEACNRRYLNSFFERLTEYLVLESAQAPAIAKSKLHIRKCGKHFYISLPVEGGDFWFSFSLRRKGWTWTIRRWSNLHGWVVADRVYRPLNESPIEMFTDIISNIGLALL